MLKKLLILTFVFSLFFCSIVNGENLVNFSIQFRKACIEKDFERLYSILHPEIQKLISFDYFKKIHPEGWAIENFEIENNYMLNEGGVVLFSCIEVDLGRKNTQSRVLLVEEVEGKLFLLNYPFLLVEFPLINQFISAPKFQLPNRETLKSP